MLIAIVILITLVVINIGRIRSNTIFKRKIKQREREFVLVYTTLESRFCTSLPTWVQVSVLASPMPASLSQLLGSALSGAQQCILSFFRPQNTSLCPLTPKPSGSQQS